MISELEILFLCSILIIILIYHGRLKNYKIKNTDKNDQLFLGHGVSSINYCISIPILLVYLIVVDELAIFLEKWFLRILISFNAEITLILIFIFILKLTLIIASSLLLNISLYPISEIKHILEIENSPDDELKIKFFKTIFFYGIFCFIWDICILYIIDVKLLALNIMICPVIFYLGMGDVLEHPKLNKKKNLLVRIFILLRSHITNCFRFLINTNFRQNVNTEAINNMKLIFKALSYLSHKKVP